MWKDNNHIVSLLFRAFLSISESSIQSSNLGCPDPDTSMQPLAFSIFIRRQQLPHYSLYDYAFAHAEFVIFYKKPIL